MDPIGRVAAVGIATGRALLGVAIFGRPNQALGQLGFGAPTPAMVTIARLAGGRDIALGMHGLANANERGRLREAVAIGALVDAGDAIAFGALLANAEHRRTALRNLPIAAGAAGLGAWVLSRL